MIQTVDRIKEAIRELIEEPLRREGCELAEINLAQYKNRSTLRLFVYCAGGASLEKCTQLSRLVGDIIDGTDYFRGGYTLEVSSPGLDRPLQSALDFKYRIGEAIRVEFVDKERQKLAGELVGIEGDLVTVRVGDEEHTIPLVEIERAKIVI